MGIPLLLLPLLLIRVQKSRAVAASQSNNRIVVCESSVAVCWMPEVVGGGEEAKWRVEF